LNQLLTVLAENKVDFIVMGGFAGDFTQLAIFT